MPPEEKIEVENINVPGSVNRVNAVKYRAMKKALLQLLPKAAPGLTQKEIQIGIPALLPEEIFPGGKTSSWWAKTVQLDLEAKKVIVREDCKPLRWHRL